MAYMFNLAIYLYCAFALKENGAEVHQNSKAGHKIKKPEETAKV